MKLPVKIALISLAVVTVFSVLLLIAADPRSKAPEFLLVIGIGSLAGAAISTMLAIIFFIAKSKQWGMGFLLSAGLLLLIGFATCTSGFYISG